MNGSRFNPRAIALSSALALIMAAATFNGGVGSAAAAPVGQGAAAIQELAQPDELMTQARVVARRTVVAGPRGVASRTVVRRGVRPVGAVGAVGVGAVGWRRPGNYWWRPGAAVAAGAAIGFVTAAAVGAWAGQPPAPGYCWYYTDPSQTQGFWDACPR